MRVCLLVLDDGREDYLERGMASARKFLPVERMQLVVIRDDDHKLGFAGAIQEGWRLALGTGAEWIVHLESDFTFNRAVPLEDMISVMGGHLTQMSLIRQPWNDEEKAAGGIVALHPDDFTSVSENGHTWLEHTRYWTTNPSVYPRWVAERGWPQMPFSEGVFGAELFGCDSKLRAGCWGRGEEWVTHVGQVRGGGGY